MIVGNEKIKGMDQQVKTNNAKEEFCDFSE